MVRFTLNYVRLLSLSLSLCLSFVYNNTFYFSQFKWFHSFELLYFNCHTHFFPSTFHMEREKMQVFFAVLFVCTKYFIPTRFNFFFLSFFSISFYCCSLFFYYFSFFFFLFSTFICFMKFCCSLVCDLMLSLYFSLPV